MNVTLLILCSLPHPRFIYYFRRHFRPFSHSVQEREPSPLTSPHTANHSSLFVSVKTLHLVVVISLLYSLCVCHSSLISRKLHIPNQVGCNNSFKALAPPHLAFHIAGPRLRLIQMSNSNGLAEQPNWRTAMTREERIRICHHIMSKLSCT